MPQEDSPPLTQLTGLLRIEECLTTEGEIHLPENITLISLIERNVVNVPNNVAFRYLDYSSSLQTHVTELTWAQFNQRLCAISAILQTHGCCGDRVGIAAPQGLEYVCGFYATLKAGMIAVPLFVPEFPGHTERLTLAIHDAEPAIILTTRTVANQIHSFINELTLPYSPNIVILDDIPNSAYEQFHSVAITPEMVSHLQYSSGTTRLPIGIEITHRCIGTNLLQMILSLNLVDRNTHGLSWLPLYHDMGLSMIGFPVTYGGHTTLMSPAAFIRRPLRWIRALSSASHYGRVVTAAPNFAYILTAQRGRPTPNDDIDLAHVTMIIGSEPVNPIAIHKFNQAFSSLGLPTNAIKPSYGIAEATLLVATTTPDECAHAIAFSRQALAHGYARHINEDHPDAILHVSCGHIARSLRAIIVDPITRDELPDGQTGEIWLHGDNIAPQYWKHPEETEKYFHAKLNNPLKHHSRTQKASSQINWLRTGDIGAYVNDQLFVLGRLVDQIQIHQHIYYPDDLENITQQASPTVRPNHVVAFTVPTERLIIIAERARGTNDYDRHIAKERIRTLIFQRCGIIPDEVQFVPAGGIPRTTSGKLARRTCRQQYLSGQLIFL